MAAPQLLSEGLINDCKMGQTWTGCAFGECMSGEWDDYSDLLIHLQQVCQWIYKPASVRSMHISVCPCWQVFLCVCLSLYVGCVSVCTPLLLQSLKSQGKTASPPCQWLRMQYPTCYGSRPRILPPAFVQVASSWIAVMVSVGKLTWSASFCIFISINVYIVASWGKTKVGCSSCF